MNCSRLIDAVRQPRTTVLTEQEKIQLTMVEFEIDVLPETPENEPEDQQQRSNNQSLHQTIQSYSETIFSEASQPSINTSSITSTSKTVIKALNDFSVNEIK